MKERYTTGIIKWLTAAATLLTAADSYAQHPFTPQRSIGPADDSITVQAHPSYNKRGRFHKFFFGENYRREWAVDTRLPVLRLSQLKGGLKPTQLGGGMQSKSLRLEDSAGNEWVIRSVEKSPEVLLPTGLKGTFARDWVDDVMSAQHPYSALIVPPIAAAVNVPHSHPVIGVVAPDKALDTFEARFANMLVLFEEREPLGKSDNTGKMKHNLEKDNDNKLDAPTFLRARMLDALIGDWDRHEDQWRWYNSGKKKKDMFYVSIPRDRDQVFHLTQGLLPKIASRAYILPTLRDFDERMTKIKWLLFKTRFVNAYPEFQFSREEWNKMAADFSEAVTDSVLEASLQQLPKSSYDLRHDELLHTLKSRRDILPQRLDEYYRFTQKVVDIRTSDKNEYVQVKDAGNGGLEVSIYKINKEQEVTDPLMSKVYDPALTKEIRIFIGDGTDSIVVDNASSKIRLRLVGGEDAKYYNIVQSRRKVKLYNNKNNSTYIGRLKRFLHDDSLNTAFTPVNLYNIWMPMATAGLNVDDGIIIGAGFKFMKQEGFRKYPYASMQQLLLSHSFSTNAFRIKYNSEWIHAIGKTDVTVHALIRAPDNTTNFFGLGNETPYDKEVHKIRYYRTRINTYQVDPAFRWRDRKTSWFSVGPSLYYYTFSPEDNIGRFINNVSEIGSYDSNIVQQNKLHLGISMQYFNDRRNSKIIPVKGYYINVRLQAYQGVGASVKSFAQLIPEFAFYKSLNKSETIVLAGRIGGVVSVGKPAFYQSAFIGGHENLLGYRQYRFAGQHSLYNNIELRVKIADVASYILPGQLGLTGFWDIGRVWKKEEISHKWHNGVGGGIYFAPASMISANLLAAYSEEGVYPYFTLGFRF